MNGYNGPVSLADLPAKRFRSRRPEDGFDERLIVEEALPGATLIEATLIEEVLVRDARGRLTPSNMVELKLIDALSAKVVTQS